MGYKPRNSSIFDLSHQEKKYTFSVITILLISNLFVCAPCFYFIQKNYSLFLGLADAQHTFLIEQLVKEKSRLYFVLSISLVVNIFISLFLVIKYTKKWSMPLRILKSHAEQAANGDYNLKPIFVRQSDELHDLIRNYNMIYEQAKKSNPSTSSSFSEARDSRHVS